MRLIVIATLVLAAAPQFVRAQDAASTPFQERRPATLDESPTPSATAKRTPAATPRPSATPLEIETTVPTVTPTPKPLPTSTPKPIPTAAAAPTATPTPKATPSPTAKPTPEPTPKPKPTPTPTPIPAPEVTESEGGSSSTLKELEERWEASLLTHDTTAIEKLVAEDFVGTSSSGKLGDKATLLAGAKSDRSVYKTAASGDLSVHSYGPNIAVVVGTSKETGKDSAGKSFSRAYRFTDTWVERNGEWQCVAAQAMALPKK